MWKGLCSPRTGILCIRIYSKSLCWELFRCFRFYLDEYVVRTHKNCRICCKTSNLTILLPILPFFQSYLCENERYACAEILLHKTEWRTFNNTIFLFIRMGDIQRKYCSYRDVLLYKIFLVSMLIAGNKIVENWHCRNDVETQRRFSRRFGDVSFRRSCFWWCALHPEVLIIDKKYQCIMFHDLYIVSWYLENSNEWGDTIYLNKRFISVIHMVLLFFYTEVLTSSDLPSSFLLQCNHGILEESFTNFNSALSRTGRNYIWLDYSFIRCLSSFY